jgi:hypothetical protein
MALMMGLGEESGWWSECCERGVGCTLSHRKGGGVRLGWG